MGINHDYGAALRRLSASLDHATVSAKWLGIEMERLAELCPDVVEWDIDDDDTDLECWADTVME